MNDDRKMEGLWHCTLCGHYHYLNFGCEFTGCTCDYGVKEDDGDREWK